MRGHGGIRGSGGLAWHRGRLAPALGVVLALVAGIGGPAAGAEPFPARPIEVIVPTPPGGGVDLSTRLLAEVAEPFLGQKLVIVNKPGGGGTVGLSAVLQAKPDGYTLASIWNAPLTITPHVLPMPYTLEDLTPVFPTGAAPLLFCVRPNFPAGTAGELVEALRRSPGRYTYGTDGVAGLVRLVGERVFRTQGVEARPVPFGGAGETVKAFLGGHVDLYLGPLSVIQPHLRAGKARCLLATARERLEVLPEVASLGDLGAPQAATGVWRGLVAPRGLAADRLAALEQAFRQATQTPRWRAYLAQHGERPAGASAVEFAELIRSEHRAFGQLVRELGLARP